MRGRITISPHPLSFFKISYQVQIKSYQEKRSPMKKPGFVITETIFSLVLAASVAAVALLAIDLKTNQFHIDRFNPFATESSKTESGSTDENSRKGDGNSQTETSVKEESSKAESKASAESEKPEESKQSSKKEEKESSQESEEESEKQESSDTDSKTIKLRSEPKNLKSQPEELENALKAYGFSLKNSVGGDRIIFVDTTSSNDKTKATVYCYQKSDSSEYWWNIIGNGKPITTDAFIGENGSNFMPAYDSKITPGGILPVGQGFYIENKPDTDYSLFEITEDTYWVTDPKSKFYNTLVEGTDKKDWKSAIHMIESEETYQYGLVIEYNTLSVDSKSASGIFLCCGSAPTEGSVAVPENVMKTILEWFESGTSATIFIQV